MCEGMTTMASHVNNFTYSKVLTIILHDIQSKSTKVVEKDEQGYVQTQPF
jgi:hypothetical protein